MVFLWKSVLCHCSDQVSGGKQLFLVFTEYKPYPHVVDLPLYFQTPVIT